MKSDAVAALFHEAQGRVAAIPGVISAGPSGGGIMGDEDGQSPVTVVGHTRTEDEDYFVQWNHVSPGFFSTVGMTLLAGRDVTEQDNEHTARVAVVNETMARQYWHTANVVGQRFGMRRDTGNEIEIIGVVRDAVTNSPREARHRMIYLPYRQDLSHLHDLCLAVRTSRDSASVAPAIRQALRSIDPSLPISSINSLDAQVDTVLADDRLVAGLSVAFGAIALLLTAAGLYGVTAYLTARRTTEIGVRMALGASRTATLLEVLRETAAMSAVGVLAGIPVALVAGRAIASRLFGIGPMDPVLIGVVALVLVAVAMIAALVPAWRAAHVSPMVALRSD